MAAPRLRLMKLIVHPVLVLDDGENITEFENSASVVAVADLAAFPERLKADIAEVQAQIDAEHAERERAVAKAQRRRPKR